MKTKGKRAQDAEILDLKALKKNIDQKDWSGALPQHKKTLQSVTFELSRIEFPAIDPKISMLRESKTRYVIAIEGWNTEVDAMKIRERFLDTQTRRKGMQCITSIRMLPHSSILYTTIDTKLLDYRSNGMNSSRMGRGKRTSTYYANEQEQLRQVYTKNIKIREDIDMRSIREAHKASVKDVLAGLHGYQSSSSKFPPPIIMAPKGQSYYKIIVKGVEKELDVLTLTTRMLGEGRERDPHFGLVRTVGMDARISALIVRVAKLNPVKNKKNEEREYFPQRKRKY